LFSIKRLKIKHFNLLKIYNNFFVASASSDLRVQQLSAVICLLFLLIYLSLQPLDFLCRIIFYKPPEAADHWDPKQTNLMPRRQKFSSHRQQLGNGCVCFWSQVPLMRSVKGKLGKEKGGEKAKLTELFVAAFAIAAVSPLIITVFITKTVKEK